MDELFVGSKWDDDSIEEMKVKHDNMKKDVESN